ncbi:MAG: tyrosine-type recombinase/integrase [Verrucomicrobiota bacterium]|jgi:integrase
MASLFKHPKSPFWSACFRLPDGRRTTRSTGTNERRKALRIANEYEDASRDAAAGRFIESRARKTIADIYAMAHPERLASSSLGDFLDAWLKRKEIEARQTTHVKYVSVVSQFTEFLGSKAERDISNITAAEITGFRDSLAKRVTPGTVNVSLKIIRSAFAQARRDGLIDLNEAERVTLLKRSQNQVERRPFTLEELRRILEAADDEWRGMLMFGLYTGQRLGDIAGLTWNNIDLQRAELHMVTGKTGRRQILPLAKPLLSFVEALPAGDAPDAPLFPRIHDRARRHKHAGNLSNEFHDILVSAGLAAKTTHKATGKGRSGKRVQNEVSFHSLRHTATSLLKAAGVSDAVAMEFVGHDSKSVSQQYTHIETSALKLAADKMPDITAIAGLGSMKKP